MERIRDHPSPVSVNAPISVNVSFRYCQLVYNNGTVSVNDDSNGSNVSRYVVNVYTNGRVTICAIYMQIQSFTSIRPFHPLLEKGMSITQENCFTNQLKSDIIPPQKLYFLGNRLVQTENILYCSIAPQMEHSFSFLKFYMKVSSP